MTRKQWFWTATITAATLAVLTITAGVMHAKQFGPGGPGGPGGRGGFGRAGGPGPGPGGPFGPLGLPRMLAEQLDVTDAQREQIRGIVSQHETEARQLGDRLGKALQAQHNAVNGETFDEGAIRAAASEVATAQAELAVLHGRVHADVLQVLTPEQHAKLRELRTEMDARQQERAKRMEERRRNGRPSRAPAE